MFSESQGADYTDNFLQHADYTEDKTLRQPISCSYLLG